MPTLVKILYHPEPVPAELAYALGSIGPPVLPVLLAALGDERVDVRCRAADAIGFSGDMTAYPALLSLLYIDEPPVCWLAARSLVRLGHPAGIRILLEPYASELVSGPGAEEIVSLVRELGVSAVPTLITALETHWREALAARILLAIGDGGGLPRKILTEPDLAIEEKIDLLTRLRKVRYSGREMYLRYDFPEVLTFCRSIANEGSGEAQEMARAVVNHLTLLRGASADTAKQSVELVRPADPDAAAGEPNEMLRAAQSPQAAATPPPRRSLWQKLRRS